ncbi:MAG TPA: hypothetical protein VI819_04120 [Patescibacteria group bacterium]|nr:hypothetical protein [Patescibacteria group bacterium]
MVERKFLVESSENAALIAGQDLYDAGDPDGQLFATLHKVKDSTVGNVWLRRFGKVERVMNERVIENQEPNLLLLGGEIYRFVTEYRDRINTNLHLKLAAQGLMSSITASIKEQNNESSLK